MSGRRFEVSGTQVVAGVLATVTGAIAASYLGVAGTVIGAAVMSVASTGGGAVYKYYLGRTARRVREAAPVITQRTVERAAAVGVRSSARRGLPSDRPAGSPLPPAHDAAEASGPARPAGQDPGDAEKHPADREKDPADGEKDRADRETGGEHGPGAGRRARPGWLAAVVGAAGIFLGVIAAVTVFELAAGKPLDAVVWHRHSSGTSVGEIVGVQGKRAAQPRHSSPATQPASRASSTPVSRSASPSPSPSSTSSPGSPSPSPSPSPSDSRTGTPAATRTPASPRTP